MTSIFNSKLFSRSSAIPAGSDVLWYGFDNLTGLSFSSIMSYDPKRRVRDTFSLIIAATNKNGIGQGGRLPWHLPKEMAYFAKVTSTAPEGKTNAVIMGRKTWESIPPKFRPLKGRFNLVVSSNEEFRKSLQDISEEELKASNTRVLGVDNYRTAMYHTSPVHNPKASDIHRAYIIGGASIFKTAIEDAYGYAYIDRILLTRILSPAFDECDVFIPEFRKQLAEDYELLWERASHEDLEAWVEFEVPRGVQKENGVEYEFQLWNTG